MKRVLTAAAIALTIYGLAVGAGTVLYASGSMPTGATHNDCAGFRTSIAEEQGIDKQDVPQEQVRDATAHCLEAHEQTAEHAFRTEFLVWSMWPAVICAVIFLVWPGWARALERQEQVELAGEAARLEPGT
jgi:hypothetical protein